MILTGPEIAHQVELGRICIEPFDSKNLGPNSYDVTLGKELRYYAGDADLDMRRVPRMVSQQIPPEGLVLRPNRLYLGSTQETACSSHFVPKLDGRSSVGRLGIQVHITAGFGDVGWGYEELEDGGLICTHPTWTLEILVVHPVKVYAGVRIAQVYFSTVAGRRQLYRGKYNRQQVPTESRLAQDFKE